MPLIKPKQIDFSVPISSSVDILEDLVVRGKITAEEFHTEYVSASIIYESGSTKFGDTLDDLHQFTGSVNITGSLFKVISPSEFTGSVYFNSNEFYIDNEELDTYIINISNTQSIFKDQGNYYSTDENLQVNNNFTLNFDGIENYFNIVVDGEEKIRVNTEGVLLLKPFSNPPTPISGGIYYGIDSNFYLGV